MRLRPSVPTVTNLKYLTCKSGSHLCTTLHQLGLGTDILAFSNTPFRACSGTSIYWLCHDPARPEHYAIIVDEVGYWSHTVTLISTSMSDDGWHAAIARHPWLKTAKRIDIQMYGESASEAKTRILQNESLLSSTQYILDLDSGIDGIRLSTNIQRNIKKASGHCSFLEINTAEGIDAYLNLVACSDARREMRAVKNVKHEHGDLRAAIDHKCSSLFFAQCDGTLVSAARISMVNDRAYYIMGGTSPRGFTIGASAFLLYSVAKKLHEQKFRSLTLGVANREGLKQFKLGLGARPVATVRYTVEPRHPALVTAATVLLKMILLVRQRQVLNAQFPFRH